MDNQETAERSAPAVGARRKIMPRVCVADAKQSIRTFIIEALEELGFATVECARAADLEAMLASNRPDLIVLGSSAGGIEACEMVELLAARKYSGTVLPVGPRLSPMLSAVRGLGEKLGLAMLPLLPTPFGEGDVRDCVATLLPPEASPARPSVAAAPAPALRYQPKIDARRLLLSGAAAVAQRGPSDADIESHVPDAAMRVVAQVIEDWHVFTSGRGHVEIAINLPVAFLQHPDAVDLLCREMPDHPGFEGLILELNAAEVVRNLELARHAARRLRQRNIALSVARLGIEWPSFVRLHDLPFVEFKVDPRLVTGCADNRMQQTTCRRILELADATGARTTAEGVASRADFLAVRDMGFHQAQGPLFAAPMTADEFVRRILENPAMAPSSA
jgi:EAL domain-containing protein (putative c-di-GMP-specific phosphodiesterase class I)